MGNKTIACATAGLLFVAACGGDDSGGEAASGFCADYKALEEKWSAEGMENPETINNQEVLADFKELDPPDELAEDWKVLLDVMDAAMIPEPDPDDPEAMADAQKKMSEAMGNIDPEAFNDAEDAIDTYIQDECGIGQE